MKNSLLTALFILSFLSSALISIGQTNNGFVINGYIEDLPENTRVYLRTASNKDTIAEAISKNGRFILKGVIPLEAAFCFLRIDSGVSKKGSAALLLNNSEIAVNSSTKIWPKLKVAGSPLQEECDKIASWIKNFNREDSTMKKRILIEHQNLQSANDLKDTVNIERLEQSINILKSEFYKKGQENYQLIINFIKSNSDSFYVPYLIMKYENTFGLPKMKEMYEGLTVRSKQSFYGKQLGDLLTGGELKIGNIFEDFAGITQDENRVSLKQILSKGKYTLLDFWASWCKPCLEEIPMLKDAYKEYHHKGFNILSISSDKNSQSWKNAIKKENLTWDHIISENKEFSISNRFKISSIPAYYLLDATGRIIAADYSYDLNSGNLREGRLSIKLKELLDK